MIEFKPRMWTSLGLGAIALVGVSACQPSTNAVGTGNAANEIVGEGVKSVAVAPPAAAVSGGETGEAGASNAYSDIPASSHLGLRVAHVTGFVLIARQAYDAGQADEASILVSQGLLEVYTPNAAALDIGAKGYKAALDAVVAAIDSKKSKTDVDAAFDSAQKIAREAELASSASPQDVIAGMLSISAGLYGGAVSAQGNDPTEYQHAMGAALSAKAAFDSYKSKLEQKNEARTQTLARDIDAMLALFPAVTMPESPASIAAVTGAASRAQLALSGMRL